MAYVAIDAGHGLHTPGKRTPDGEREWSFNNKVALAAIAKLQYNGVKVLRVDDPTGATDISLSTRTSKANAAGVGLYLSIHHNANTGQWGSWTGTETFTYDGSNPKSEAAAKEIHKRLVGAMGLRDRGMKKDNFHVLRETKMAAVLTEGGYMDSTIDIKKLRDDNVLKAAGEAIADGIMAYFGITPKVVVAAPVAAPAPEPKPQPTPVKPVAKPKSHTVEKGETFYSIAKKYGMAVADIQKFNPRVDSTKMQAGDVIYLYAAPVVKPAPKPAPKPVSKPAPKPVTAPKKKYELPSGILKLGSFGSSVKLLQNALNAAGFKLKGSVDGDFGPDTLQALKRFQSVHCNPADGVYGAKTREALNKVLNK
jgi:N-acetylmuramoyl-L-alanine amidase